MRNSIFALLLITLFGCGKAPVVPAAATNAKSIVATPAPSPTPSPSPTSSEHSYTLTLLGQSCTISATIITPDNGQVLAPSGGGTVVLGASATSISIVGLTGDAQISNIGGCLQVQATVFKDGTQVGNHFVASGASFDFGAL